MLSVNFNGHELNKYIGVLSGFTLLKGAEFLLDLQDIDGGNGSRVFNTHYGPKTIPMPFMARNDLINKYDELQRILKVDEPKPLIFGNAPDRIYYAMPVGDMDMDEFLNFGKGTITWLVPDGLAHATTETPFQATLNSDGVLEATVVNDRTAEVPISYEIKHKSDNGYVGIVSEYGVMEFGNIQEADGTELTKTVTLTSNQKGDFANWTNGTVFAENPTKKAVTTMDSDSNFGGRLGLLPSGMTGDGSAYYGAIKEFTATETADSWYIWARAWFETGKVEQTGMWTLAVVSDEGKPIAAMSIHKSSLVSNDAIVTFQLGKPDGTMNNVKEIKFTPSYWLPPNVYGAQSIDKNSNMFDLKKEGDKVTFFYWGGYHSFVLDSEVASYQAEKVQFFIGQFGTREAGKRVTHMYLNDFTFRKLNVPYVRDDPNRYGDGTLLTIDGNERKPYVNGMLRLDDEVIGTKYFLAPPGETKIQFYFSDFANPLPDVKLSIRKAWL